VPIRPYTSRRFCLQAMNRSQRGEEGVQELLCTLTTRRKSGGPRRLWVFLDAALADITRPEGLVGRANHD
jgi:hypothetical protein